MKTCPNCHVIYADDYAGTCTECGRGMGSVEANGGQDLVFRYARQVAATANEDSLERQLRSARGRGGAKQGDAYDRVTVNEAVMDVARSFVTFDPSKVQEGESA